MAKFKVGDVCILHSLVNFPEENGMEVTIKCIVPSGVVVVLVHSGEYVQNDDNLYICDMNTDTGYAGRNLRLKQFPGEEQVMKLFTEVTKRDVVTA